MARKETDKRITATIPVKQYEKLEQIAEHLSKERGMYISLSEVLRDAIDLEIKYHMEDYYPLAKIESARFNQFIDTMEATKSEVKNTRLVTEHGFNTLISAAKEDATSNYLAIREENMDDGGDE